jgi:NADH dehydrogenase (ubiquinone) Fe-S protein 6
MLSSARSRLASFAARTPSPFLLRPLSTSPFLSNQGPGTGENRVQANDPTPRNEIPNVSTTNETAVDAMGAQDKALQESQADAERQRQLQAPNRSGIWSRSQQERSVAMSGPRFEQTIIETQVA